VLGHLHQGLQGVQPLTEQLALLHQGNLLLHGGTDPKELAHFIEGSAVARGLGHASEPAHGVVALFDATVILLESIVEIVVGPVEHITAKGLADRTWVGVMSIGRHPLWCVTNHIDSLLEKAPGCLGNSLLTQPGVNQIAIAIDGAREVAPFSLDVDVGFIDIPGPASLSSSLDSQLVGDEWGKTGLRVSNGLMGELKAALQEHLRQITQTQLIPQPPEHDEQDDIGGIVEKVERRSCTLVEGSLARLSQRNVR